MIRNLIFKCPNSKAVTCITPVDSISVNAKENKVIIRDGKLQPLLTYATTLQNLGIASFLVFEETGGMHLTVNMPVGSAVHYETVVEVCFKEEQAKTTSPECPY